ncbi:TolC family protein, partial [bacterium]|nr:TolC family protein [bacterium]
AVLDIPFASSQDAVSFASEHSSKMKRIASQELSATSALNAAKWNRLPEFSIGIGQKQTNLSENGLYIEGELEIPLFNQRNRYVQSARVQADRARELRSNLDSRFESEVARAYVQWNSLKAAPMLNVTPEEVMVSLQTATSLYLSGETGYLELLDAFASSRSTLQSIYALETARWQADLALRQLTGYPILETN